MTDAHNYQPPVSALLEIGSPEEIEVDKWTDYVAEYGLTHDHIPELIRLLHDTDFDEVDSEEDPTYYAVVHATRALGQVRNIEALAALFHYITMETHFYWVLEEIPHVVAMYGPEAIPHIKTVMELNRQELHIPTTLLECLERLVDRHPEETDTLKEIVIEFLRESSQNNPEFNGFLIGSIIEYRIEDALPVAKAAFEREEIAVMIAGDYDDLLVEFGHKEPDPNKKRPPLFPGLFDDVSPFPPMPDKLAPEKSIKELREERKQRKKAEREAKQNKKK